MDPARQSEVLGGLMALAAWNKCALTPFSFRLAAMDSRAPNGEE
jgi:hypothetical protein